MNVFFFLFTNASTSYLTPTHALIYTNMSCVPFFVQRHYDILFSEAGSHLRIQNYQIRFTFYFKFKCIQT